MKNTNEELLNCYVFFKREEKSLFSCLEKNCIAYIPLKGSAIREYYEEPQTRLSSDIDVLIKKSDLKLAEKVLKNDLSCKEDFRTNHDFTLTLPSGLRVELHHSIMDEEDSELVEKIWSTAVLSDGSYGYKMSDDMFVHTLLLHIYRHFMTGGCGQKFFNDIKVFLTAKKDFKYIPKNKFEKEIIAYSLGEETDLKPLLDNFINSSKEYGTIENYSAIQSLKSMSRLSWIKSRMFLPKEVFEKTYPEVKSHPILYPFCLLHRWIRIIIHLPDKRLINKIKNYEVASEKEKEDIKLLFTKLEII